MKTRLTLAAALLALAVPAAVAQTSPKGSTTPASAQPMRVAGQDVAVSIGIDYVSEYVFRGLSFDNDALQPYVEASVGGFTVGAWASTGIGGNEFATGADEVDLYASYGRSLTDKLSGSVGVTYFHFPETGDFFETDGGSAGTYEINAGLSYDTVLSPAATAYYDFTLDTFTLEGSLSHSIPLNVDRTSVDLGLVGGFVTGDGTDYEWATASAALSYAFSGNASVYGAAYFTLNSEDALDFNDLATTGEGDDNLFWAGIGISNTF